MWHLIAWMHWWDGGGAVLPPDYYLPRNPTVRHGPTITATATVAPTLNPTVTRIR